MIREDGRYEIRYDKMIREDNISTSGVGRTYACSQYTYMLVDPLQLRRLPPQMQKSEGWGLGGGGGQKRQKSV